MIELPKILIAVLTTHERAGWPHRSIISWMESMRLAGDKFPYAVRVMNMHNYIPAASARNHACKFFKEHTDADWLMMIDNDMAIPENILDTIKDAPKDAAVIVPVFYLWDETGNENGAIPNLVLCWGTKDVTQDHTTKDWLLKTPGFKELMKVGTGVVFIHRSAIESIPEPYFWYTYGEDQGMKATEDINFCMKIRGCGMKIYGNPKIEVGHYHNVNLLALSRLLEKTREDAGKVSEEASAVSSEVSSSPAESPSTGSVVAASPAC